MKTVLLNVAADSNAAYTWQEDAVVRRVILSGAIRTTTNVLLEVMVRRGPGSNNDLAHGDANVVAGMVLSAAGTNAVSHAIDVPVWEQVRIGDVWHITANAVSGSGSDERAMAVLAYEPG